MAGIMKDKLVAETELAGSGISKWTILRGGWLGNGSENLDKVKFVDVKKASTISWASRQDIGAVGVKLVEDGYGDDYWGKTVNVVSG